MVTNALIARKDLSALAKMLFLEALTRLYSDLPTIPISAHLFAPKASKIEQNEALSALSRLKFITKIPKVDGTHISIDKTHAIFVPVPVKERTLANYTANLLSTITLTDFETLWRNLYFKQFKEQPKREPQDLVRFRRIIKKQGADKAVEGLTQFIYRHRNAKQKCTTHALFYNYGR